MRAADSSCISVIMERDQEFFVEVMPEGSLEVLSRKEAELLQHAGAGGLQPLLRRCALAVLNWGSETDSAKEVLESFRDFELRILQQNHGVTLGLKNAPASAFVDGEMVRGIRELLFAVLRDIVFIHEVRTHGRSSEAVGADATELVFDMLRNANVLRYGLEPDIVVCWGGHAISREEYDYTKVVGYELGLRGLNVCTGCGPGAMKGPMKGATIGHSKQRISNGRYIGLTEPGIIAAEPPNPIVSELVVLPDMEKRLEAFVRIAHSIVVFPGGVGTLEEILYLLGIFLHPDNQDVPLPLILTGPASSADYFAMVDEFIVAVFGESARDHYRIIIDQPVEVARQVRAGVETVHAYRNSIRDAWFFNWQLRVPEDFQRPFTATHASMANLRIQPDMPVHELAANLRRAFSGIVAGNIREEGIQAIEDQGPFEIHGDSGLMARLDKLLATCVAEGRMRLPGKPYEPCYRVVQHPQM